MSATRTSTYNQLHRIAKRGVHQPADRLTHFRTQLFRRKTQQRRQRHNRQEVDDKNPGRIHPQCPQHDTHGHEDEKHVDVVAGESQPRQVHEVGRPPHPATIIVVQRFALVVDAQIVQGLRDRICAGSTGAVVIVAQERRLLALSALGRPIAPYTRLLSRHGPRPLTVSPALLDELALYGPVVAWRRVACASADDAPRARAHDRSGSGLTSTHDTRCCRR